MMEFRREKVSAALTIFLAATLLPGCGDPSPTKVGISDLESRIARLEQVFPERAFMFGDTGEEVVTVAPEYREEEERRRFSFPSDSGLLEGLPADLPPEVRDQVRAHLERVMRGDSIGGTMTRIRTLPGDTAEWEPAVSEANGSLVVARTSMPAVVVRDRIYVLGGHGPGRMLEIFRNDLEIVDAERHAWRNKTSLLRRRYHTAEEYGGKIYIVGGHTTGTHRPGWRSSFPDIVEIYDPSRCTFSTGAPLPSPRYLASSVLLDGKIYLVGGCPPQMRPHRDEDGGTTTSTANSPPDNKLFIYDIARNQWSEGAPMAVARQCDVVAWNGRIYAVAGYDGERAVAAFEEYDPKTGRWTRLPDLPFSLSANRCMVSGNYLFSFGDFTEMNRICVYDFTARAWRKLNLPMKPMRHGAVVILGDNVYVLGGNAGRGRGDYDGGAGGDPLSTIQVFPLATLTRAAQSAFR